MCFKKSHGSYFCSAIFKLITTLLARRIRLVIFTLSRGPFHLFLFSLISFFSLFPRCFSRSVSPLLRCANIIKLSRLYYTTMLQFYFLAPFVILNLHAFKYSRVSSYSTVLFHLYAASRWDVAKLCNFIANRDFHFPSCLLCFINFPAFLDRAFPVLFLHRPLYYRVTVISNNYAILLHLSFESLYLMSWTFLLPWYFVQPPTTESSPYSTFL